MTAYQFEIRLKGTLADHWAARFDGATSRATEDGDTVLEGRAAEWLEPHCSHFGRRAMQAAPRTQPDVEPRKHLPSAEALLGSFTLGGESTGTRVARNESGRGGPVARAGNRRRVG